MADAETRLLRYRVVEELVLLAASPEEQLAYLARTRLPGEELVLQGLTWQAEALLPMLKRRKGALSEKAVVTTAAVTDALETLDTEVGVEYKQTGRSFELFSSDGIRSDPRWERIRQLAKEALAAFRAMGIPTPTLTDPDYNARRKDAP